MQLNFMQIQYSHLAVKVKYDMSQRYNMSQRKEVNNFERSVKIACHVSGKYIRAIVVELL